MFRLPTYRRQSIRLLAGVCRSTKSTECCSENCSHSVCSSASVKGVLFFLSNRTPRVLRSYLISLPIFSSSLRTTLCKSSESSDEDKLDGFVILFIRVCASVGEVVVLWQEIYDQELMTSSLQFLRVSDCLLYALSLSSRKCVPRTLRSPLLPFGA